MKLQNVNSEWVKTMMEKYNISRGEMADYLDLDPNTLSTWLSENGRSTVRTASQRSSFFYFFSWFKQHTEMDIDIDMIDKLRNIARAEPDEVINSDGMIYRVKREDNPFTWGEVLKACYQLFDGKDRKASESVIKAVKPHFEAYFQSHNRSEFGASPVASYIWKHKIAYKYIRK